LQDKNIWIKIMKNNYQVFFCLLLLFVTACQTYQGPVTSDEFSIVITDGVVSPRAIKAVQDTVITLTVDNLKPVPHKAYLFTPLASQNLETISNEDYLFSFDVEAKSIQTITITTPNGPGQYDLVFFESADVYYPIQLIVVAEGY
jgi:hypothetical protein